MKHDLIEIYEMDDCPLCAEARRLCEEADAPHVLLDLDRLDRHPERDDAQAQLALQGMAAPLIRVGGMWTDLAGLRQALGLGAETSA